MIDLKTKDKIPGVKKIIAVASGKGGVGKSTVSANVAYSLAQQGFKTAIYDADIYGPSIPTIFDLDLFHPEIIQFGENELILPAIKENIQIMSIGFFLNPDQPAIWRGPLASSYLKKFLIDTQWNDVDYLIIDLPPGTGDIALTLCQDIPLDGAIMVTTPQNLALIDVQKSLMMFKNREFNIPIIGVVENMSWFTPELHKDEKYYLFGKDGGKSLAENFKTELLAQIPLIEDLCQADDKDNFKCFTENKIIKTEFNKIANKISSSIKL